MLHKVDLQQFKTLGCNVKEFKGQDSVVIEYSKDGGKFFAQGTSGNFCNVDWSDIQFISFDAYNHEDVAMRVCFEFYSSENDTDIPDMTVRMGILPKITTVLSLPIEVLNSQQTFLKRTPGRLKAMVIGKKLDPKCVSRFAISIDKYNKEQTLEISNLRFTDKEVEYNLPDMAIVDELGQLSDREWPGKTANEQEMIHYLHEELEKAGELLVNEEFGQYGGYKARKFEANGYFKTHYDGNRWWLVDPEGYAFISNGLDSVVPGESGRIDKIEKFFKWLPEKEGKFQDAWLSGERFDKSDYYNFAVSNLIKAFGENWFENWVKITRKRLVEWGFNTIGNWSSLDFINKTKIPYVWPLANFPRTSKYIYRDFPDVFSEEYELNSVIYAQQLKKFEDDKYLIGYFLGNEPNWAFVENLNIAEELLDTEGDFASKDELIKFMSDRYHGNIQSFNKSWNVSFTGFEQLKNKIQKAANLSEKAACDLYDFSKIMTARFIEIPSKAAKKVDSYHLNLGIRYAYVHDEILYEGHENFDVFSINCYSFNPAEKIKQAGEKTGLPVMIGEFHFSALDRGLISHGIRAVSSQEERAKAYRYYVEQSASIPNFVGAHYFILNDQSVLGRFDGENFQIGCVDVCHKPYKEFVKGVTEANYDIYKIVDGKKIRNDPPVEVETNSI